MASLSVAGKLGSLQPRIDLVRDDPPQRGRRGVDRGDLHGCQFMAGFDEGLEREHPIREERIPKRLVRDESSDQNLDAAMCHAARLSRPLGGNRNATTGA